MIIDTVALQEIISKLPDANTYHYDRYIAIYFDGVGPSREIIFDRYTFADRTKRWALELAQ